MKRNYLSSILAGLVSVGCASRYVKPDSQLSQKEPQKLEDKLLGIAEDECYSAKISNLTYDDLPTKVLLCYDKSESRPRWSVNLNRMDGIMLRENYFPWIIEWFWGNDVLIETKSGEAYSVRLWDKNAREMAKLLIQYRKLTEAK